MKNPVAGFRPMTCHKRPAPGADANKAGGAMQWVFSDGLASVSLFVEAFDAKRHKVEGVMALGATHALTRRMSDKSGDWWLRVGYGRINGIVIGRVEDVEDRMDGVASLDHGDHCWQHAGISGRSASWRAGAWLA